MRAAVSVLSGQADDSVVDPDVYRRLAADLTANGGRVVADLSGAYLAAVLDGGVEFLKVSHGELLADDRAGKDTVDDLLDGDAYEVCPPQLQVADHRGAGDSMAAGVTAVLVRGR